MCATAVFNFSRLSGQDKAALSKKEREATAKRLKEVMSLLQGDRRPAALTAVA